jgi:adenosylhomocysteine nucleosidase
MGRIRRILRTSLWPAFIEGKFAMLLVTFAVPHESRFFRRCAAAEGVRVLHTGIGGDAAARALRAELENDRPSAVVSSGFAGGLDPGLRVGDVIADSEKSSPELLQILPAEVRRGRIQTASKPVDSAEAKAELFKVSGAQAVDMESAAIVAVCVDAGIPLLVLRVISDAAEDEIPVPLHVAWDLNAQRPRPMRLCLYLARHPTRVGEFLRFLRQTNVAAKNLAAWVNVSVSERSPTRT